MLSSTGKVKIHKMSVFLVSHETSPGEFVYNELDKDSRSMKSCLNDMLSERNESEEQFLFCKCHAPLNGVLRPSRIRRSQTVPDFKFFSGFASAAKMTAIVMMANSMTGRDSEPEASKSPFYSYTAAFQHVRENLEDLNGIGANETDLLFLKSLLDSPTMKSLVKAQDKLEESLEPSEPLSTGNLSLINDICQSCEKLRSLDAQELNRILSQPYFKSLLGTHDSIAERYNFPSSPELAPLAEIDSIDFFPNGTAMTADAIRVIGLRKNPNEPLGLTVEQDDNGNLVVARILAGGMIDKQALLSKGDIILEVNGIAVTTPEDLVTEIAKSRDTVTLKIAPSFEDTTAITGVVNGKIANGYGTNGINTMIYMRALFDYNPKEDTLLPCKEIGLEFKRGDVLQVLNQNDPNWWQAKKVGSNGPAGLIPSQELEERRKAFVCPEADFVHKISICGTRISKKKRKILYQMKANSEFDKAELLLYEEVTKMPPFKRKTLVLIGCQGVGRRTLKNRIINSDPEKFAGVTPITSRPRREYEENGRTYWFMDREDMERDIREHKFLEYGEHNNHLYGTSLDSIREVIKQGKMCVLDCSPTALKILHNSSEFMPYVIFIAAPGMEQLKHLYYENRPFGASSRNLTFDRLNSMRYSSRRARTLESLASIYEEDDLKRTLEESSCMQRTYDKYIDFTIVNEDFDVTFRKVIEQLEKMSTEHQWVPVNWVY